jgi:hypothetical protein
LLAGFDGAVVEVCGGHLGLSLEMGDAGWMRPRGIEIRVAPMHQE